MALGGSSQVLTLHQLTPQTLAPDLTN